MKYINKTILSATDDVSQNGAAIEADQLIAASFVFLFGDTDVAGTAKIQASNDPQAVQIPVPHAPSDASWKDIPNATASVTAGVAPLILVPVMSFKYIRAVFVQSAPGGTTVTCDMTAQSV